MSYGIAARRLGLIHDAAINDMSGLAVKLFLPALIIVNLGEQLHWSTVMNYIPSPYAQVWSISYTCASIGIVHVISRMFNLPQWVKPACSFNNTTSLPLLLLDALDSVGSLRLILRKGESTSEEIDRAQSYFLVCAVISKTIAYVVGPRMLQDHKPISIPSSRGYEPESNSNNRNHSEESQDELLTETTSLLPQLTQPYIHTLNTHIKRYKTRLSSLLPTRMKQNFMASFGSPFADVAICCTILGAILGLVPTLHRAFFARDEDGGIFHAWLTTSVRNLGRLFTTLQIFLVGCKLGVTIERMILERRGQQDGGDEITAENSERDGSSGRIPIPAMVFVFIFRLILWPAISISMIYGFAKTGVLGDDPMLWFSMMLMPAGPPALVILGLAELAQASDGEKMAIAKSLTIMYALSPVVCFTITGALKAVEAVLDEES
ncbi:Auxin efflux carrier [Penicillium herquei]|nr:Auxin efflux carrier [Penicillium herquei]